MEDLTAQDIEFRMKEYLEMNVPPFDVKELKVQQQYINPNNYFLSKFKTIDTLYTNDML